jgi:putative transposase
MTISFARHQFPPGIIRHAVWIYLRFTLSFRDVEDLLAERGLDVSYETVRRWVLKVGPMFARELRRRRPRPTAKWHLDEMAVMIGGRPFWLWRAVDDEGEVLDLLVQRRRDKVATVKLMRKLLKKQGFAPDVLVTDKLRSYGAAKSEMRLCARHEQGLRKNNRAENFASSGATTRAQDAALQIAWISATVPVRSRRRPEHFQHPAPSHIPPHAPRPSKGSLSEVASRHRGLSRNLALQYPGPNSVRVTAPRRGLLRSLGSEL